MQPLGDCNSSTSLSLDNKLLLLRFVTIVFPVISVVVVVLVVDWLVCSFLPSLEDRLLVLTYLFPFLKVIHRIPTRPI